MTGQLLDILLAVSVLAAAVAAVFAPRRMAASMAFLVLGLLLAFVWARLLAPDIALAEAVIASGVTGALLVGTVTEHPGTSRRGGNRSLAVLETLVGLAAAAVLAVAFVSALRDGASVLRLGATVVDTVPQSPVSHPVTAVLLDFRAYDTLLEVAVLTAAAVAALALHRAGRLDTVRLSTDTRPVLAAMIRVVVPLALVIAAWLLVAGSTRTGGAFQAGAMVTGALLLLYVGGYADLTTSARWALPGVLFGLAVFLLTAAGTLAFADGWLVMDEPWGGPVILALETALAASIGVALSALFLAGFADRGTEQLL
jgi:multisubunit Na+/H+ antiporter MnhB subunit